MSEFARVAELKPAVVDQITPEQIDAQMELMKQLCPDKARFKEVWESAENDILWLAAELRFPDDAGVRFNFYCQLLSAGRELLGDESYLSDDIINRLVILSQEGEPGLVNWVLSERTAGSESEAVKSTVEPEEPEKTTDDSDIILF